MGSKKKLYHIMFLPVVGNFDHDFIFNVGIMLLFLGIYIWHSRREHNHTDELLSEVKKIREKLDKDFGDDDGFPGGKLHPHDGGTHIH